MRDYRTSDDRITYCFPLAAELLNLWRWRCRDVVHFAGPAGAAAGVDYAVGGLLEVTRFGFSLFYQRRPQVGLQLQDVGSVAEVLPAS